MTGLVVAAFKHATLSSSPGWTINPSVSPLLLVTHPGLQLFYWFVLVLSSPPPHLHTASRRREKWSRAPWHLNTYTLTATWNHATIRLLQSVTGLAYVHTHTHFNTSCCLFGQFWKRAIAKMYLIHPDSFGTTTSFILDQVCLSIQSSHSISIII